MKPERKSEPTNLLLPCRSQVLELGDVAAVEGVEQIDQPLLVGSVQ